jgi:transcriptional regulator GlxA family with amidase domain
MDLRVEKIIVLLNENFQHELLFNEMARSMNLSPLRLRRLFKEETGVTLNRYLRSLRIQRAKVLIESTFLSMKEVMSQVGIKDKSHFVKEFRKVYGIAPSKYRSRYSAADIDLVSVVKRR